MTDYTYYEADYTGKTVGGSYHNLFAIDPSSPKIIDYATYGLGSGSKSNGVLHLKHEPSWEVATVNVSSPQMGTASKKEEYFYFYDLLNRYDRHWYLFDITQNIKFGVQVIGSDTIAVNNILSNAMRTNNYSLPRYEGMESARAHNTRSLVFQKSSHTKNASDSKPLVRSEFYHFDNSWTFTNAQSYQPVLLRFASVQLDTLVVTNGNFDFRKYRIDRDNDYIADFMAVSATLQPDGKTYIYSLLNPFDHLKMRTITTRNRLMIPEIIEDQTGLKTRYVINTTVGSNGNMTNLGLVENITVGYTRSDARVSSFLYNTKGMISKLTEPTLRYVEYLYDDYQRLNKITENGTRVLSEFEYNIWNQNTTLNFEQRTNQNNIFSTIYNSAEPNDKELIKSFIDPLGREHSTLQAYYDFSLTLQKIHSPSVVFDNWNRITKVYKSYSGTGTNLDLSTNTTTTFTEQYYENQLSSRIIKAANYGEDISTSAHTIQNQYTLVSGSVAYCELGLTNEEAKVMMSSSTVGYSFKFLKQITTDQDGKQNITYTNAFGQLAAKVSYTDGTTAALTLFGYDSYGHINRVINPNKQVSTYLYNILGQLVMETSVDAGTKRYMYNKHGLVSVAQDEYERTRTVSGTFTPRYRVFKYDDYGNITSVGMMNVTLTSGQLRDPLLYQTTMDGIMPTPTFKYVFSNSSTYDWLCSYTKSSKSGAVTVVVTPSTFVIQQWEKSFAYGITSPSNSLGRLIQDNSFNNTGTKILKNVYTYNNEGNIASQVSAFSPVNADGTVELTVSKIEYPAYNYRGNLLEEKVDVDNDGTFDLHMFYEHDRLNRLVGIRAAMGVVALSADATLLVSYTYDIDGKITKKEHRIDDNTAINRMAMEIAYNYDVRDRLTQIDAKNATASVARYSLFYDAQIPVSGANNVLSHQNWNGNINGSLMEYNFTSADNVVGSFTGSTLYGFEYDPMNRLTKADAAIADLISENASQGALIGDEECTYDKIGNITSLKRSIRGIGANFAETEWWNYTYQSGNNRLTGVVGQNTYSVNRSYTYDANGNLLSDSYHQINQTNYGRAAYAFNITKGTDIIDYLYDAKDQRIYKKEDATDDAQDKEEYYLQDITGKTIAIKTKQSGVTTWNYYISGAEREMMITPTSVQAPGSNATNTMKRIGFSQTNAFLYDHLGNTRVSYTPLSWDDVSSRTTFRVSHVVDYAPYGKIIREFVDGEKAKYLTTQHERDVETGLDYRGARYYDSDVARFLSLDPLAAKFPEWSAYNYVMGNPVALIDPDGLAPNPFWGKLLDGVQIVIDVVGFVPVAGEVADGINLFIDVVRAETPEERAIVVATGLASMIPIVGWGAGVTKISKRVLKIFKKTKKGKTPSIEIGDHEIIEGPRNPKSDRTAEDPLRLDKNGKKITDPEAEGTNHTQLGRKKGRKGSYRQGREFNKDNQEVRDIDFTDHDRPSEHPNPHQHDYNGPGKGSRQRGKAKKL